MNKAVITNLAILSFATVFLTNIFAQGKKSEEDLQYRLQRMKSIYYERKSRREDVSEIEKYQSELKSGKINEERMREILNDLESKFSNEINEFEIVFKELEKLIQEKSPITNKKLPDSIDEINVGIWFTPEVSSNKDVAILSRINPQIVSRAYYKYPGTAEKGKYFPADRVKKLSNIFHSSGILFGGGIQVAELGESELPKEEFLDYVTRTPKNELRYIENMWNQKKCHGAIANEAFLDYVLFLAYQQIDAGVDCLHFDEPGGAYGLEEGYDNYSIKEFRQYLLEKYCIGKGWKIDDPRWIKEKKVNFNDPMQCPDKTMNSFDYRGYLKANGWFKNVGGFSKETKIELQEDNKLKIEPPPANPFFEDWGFPHAEIFNPESFWAQRFTRAWKYICDKVREYAAKRNKKVYITGNGINPFVDYHERGIYCGAGQDWPADPETKKLDGKQVKINFWRWVESDAEKIRGAKKPVFVFDDFGNEGHPLNNIPAPEVEEYIRIYSAEIYAAGLKYFFPVRNGGYDATLRPRVLKAIIQMADFFNKYSEIYSNVSINLEESRVKVNNIIPFNGTELNYQKLFEILLQKKDKTPDRRNESLVSFSLMDSRNGLKTYLHLINHNWDKEKHCIVPQKNIPVFLPIDSKKVKEVVLVSSDFPDEQKIQFVAKEDGIHFVVPNLQYYDVIIFDRKENEK